MCAKCEVFDINPWVVGEFIGKPNAMYLSDLGTCIFGCGSIVDSDTGICHECGDHSANVACCEECGAEYEDWGGEWKQTIGERTIPTEFVV